MGKRIKDGKSEGWIGKEKRRRGKRGKMENVKRGLGGEGRYYMGKSSEGRGKGGDKEMKKKGKSAWKNGKR